MDPRANMTTPELNDQLRLGLEMFAEVQKTRKIQAEIGTVKKRLSDAKTPVMAKSPELLPQLTAVEAAVEKIAKGEGSPFAISGLDAATTGMSAALRVVEGSDRTTPSQAVDLYHQSDEAAKNAIADWTSLKSSQLAQLNEALQKAGISAIQLSEIEREAETSLSQ